MRFTSTQFKTETKRDDSVELSRFFYFNLLEMKTFFGVASMKKLIQILKQQTTLQMGWECSFGL